MQYKASSLEDLRVIIAHFDRYKLLTQKRADFELFKRIVDLMDRKEHLTIEGLEKIVAIKASMNKGLSDTLTAAFPNIKPVPRPLVLPTEIKDSNWLTGFVSGEGCFSVVISKSSLNKIGAHSKLRFSIAQHSRDASLLKSLEKYLGCGSVNKHSEYATVFIVRKFADITKKIIPVFDKYKIVGVKSKDYED